MTRCIIPINKKKDVVINSKTNFIFENLQAVNSRKRETVITKKKNRYSDNDSQEISDKS
jgi:hypothetical protein